MRDPNPCILEKSNLFQPNTQVSTCCPNDAAMCKSTEKSTSTSGYHARYFDSSSAKLVNDDGGPFSFPME